jgi:subtilisin family serine protease
VTPKISPDTGELRAFLESVPDEMLARARSGRGDGVRVAIIDSGVEAAHPDLQARVTRSLEVRGDGAVVDAAPIDPAGHGTACADIVGRLAPACELWSLRVLGAANQGASRSLVRALRWAIDEGADVINLSLGTRDPAMAEVLRGLVDDAYRKSLLVVAAANNLPGTISYPAVFSSLVGVDAAYLTDPELFTFELGKSVELVAPGVYVEAAWPGGGRKLVTGTSFACPHMSGHIARILSRNPGMRPFQLKTVLYAMGLRNASRVREAS